MAVGLLVAGACRPLPGSPANGAAPDFRSA
jgi:hypothetical protein